MMAMSSSFFLRRRMKRCVFATAILLVAACSIAGGFHIADLRVDVGSALLERSASLTRSFAAAAGTWLALDHRASLDVASHLLLQTGATGLQILAASGSVYERGATGGWEPLNVTEWIESAQLRGGFLLAASSIEVTVPLSISSDDPPYGCVRISYSADRLNEAIFSRLAIVTAACVALVGGLAAGLQLVKRRLLVGACDESAGGPLTIDAASKRVTVLDEAISLSPKLFALLSCLAKVPGRVYSDAEILDAVWPESEYADAKDVKQCVYMLRRRLRSVLDDPERVIVNVKGYGYRLDLFRV